MPLNLKCYFRGQKCPPYLHEGIFSADNATVQGLLPDLARCAACMAALPPPLPSFRDDLLQLASLTLLEKGPAYQPGHDSGASFGSFIRPRICTRLTHARFKELKHHDRERLSPEPSWDFHASHQTDSFEADVIWDITVAAFQQALPHLFETLTAREKQVFSLIRKDLRKTDIAERLGVSPGRISQLTQQVERKLKQACLEAGILEDG